MQKSLQPKEKKKAKEKLKDAELELVAEGSKKITRKKTKLRLANSAKITDLAQREKLLRGAGTSRSLWVGKCYLRCYRN